MNSESDSALCKIFEGNFFLPCSLSLETYGVCLLDIVCSSVEAHFCRGNIGSSFFWITPPQSHPPCPPFLEDVRSTLVRVPLPSRGGSFFQYALVTYGRNLIF